MNLALFNDKWTSILQGLSTTGSLEHFVQNHQVLREISLILRVNERMVVAVGTAMHGQLANIYCASAAGWCGGVQDVPLLSFKYPKCPDVPLPSFKYLFFPADV